MSSVGRSHESALKRDLINLVQCEILVLIAYECSEGLNGPVLAHSLVRAVTTSTNAKRVKM